MCENSRPLPQRFAVGRRTVLAGIAALAAAPAVARDGAPDIWELPIEGMERISPTVWVGALAPGIWVSCFTFDAPGLGYVPCNGLIVAGPSGATIVDTGNTGEQGDLLLGAAKRLTGQPAAQAIATHFHNDRAGGTAAMRAAGVPVLAHPYTVGLALAYGERVPEPVKGLERGPVTLGPVELFHPGAGHTRDNITVWHQASGTLFGGCLLRATSDKGIGSRADADMAAYPATLDRLVERYPQRRFVVPGHGTIRGDALIWTRSRVAAAIARTAPPSG